MIFSVETNGSQWRALINGRWTRWQSLTSVGHDMLVELELTAKAAARHQPSFPLKPTNAEVAEATRLWQANGWDQKIPMGRSGIPEKPGRQAFVGKPRQPKVSTEESRKAESFLKDLGL